MTTVETMESIKGQMLNVERVLELDNWLKTTNTKLTQVNGQRKYGGPPEEWDGPTPGARCEVFISQVPRDAYEDLLIPLFSSVGPLWEFRLMMNFSGQNRGFAYAKYGSPAMASSAVRMLHGHVMKPGFRLNVRRSTEKRHLCMGDLPAFTKPGDLLQVLRVWCEGVERVSLKAGPGIDGVTAIIAFASHHAASMAKKVLVEAFKKQFSLTVSISWLSTGKPSSDELLPQQHLPKASLSIKPPRYTISTPQPSVLPLRPVHLPSSPPGFCKTVGGPTALQYPSDSTSSLTQELLVSAASPMMVLRTMCEAAGFGQPHCEISCCHAGPDGFLYFAYKVCVCGMNVEFEGVIKILPGATVTSTLEEAQWAAAQDVLNRVCQNQLPH